MTPFYIVAGNRAYRLTTHVLIRLGQREAEESWIIQVLENPVAVENDEQHRSRNYFGFIEGRRALFRVAVSMLDDESVVTIYFDSQATRKYERGEL